MFDALNAEAMASQSFPKVRLTHSREDVQTWRAGRTRAEASGGGRAARGRPSPAPGLRRPGCRSGGIQAALGLGVDVGGQRPSLHYLDVVAEVLRIDGPDDVRVHVWVGEGEAQDELHR